MLVNVEMRYLVDQLSKMLGSEYSIKEEQVKKNNATLPALLVESKALPEASMYYYPAYGKTADDMAREIKSQVDVLRSQNLTALARNLNNWYALKNYAWFRLTTDSEYAEKYPHVRYAGDMYIIPVVKIAIGDEDASTMINENNLIALGVTLEEFLSAAFKNIAAKAVLTPIEDMLYASMTGDNKKIRNILYDNAIERYVQMYVLTVLDTTDGASTIATPAVLEQLKRLFPDGAYVIPSSIHEVILVDSNAMPPEEITEMIAETNETEVDPCDRLSNHVYRFEDGRFFSV